MSNKNSEYLAELDQALKDKPTYLDNYYRFSRGCEKANFKIRRNVENAVILVGPSKSGKTTLLHYLMNKKLKQDKDCFTPQQQLPDAFVEHEIKSCTSIPNIFKHRQHNCDIVDLPGFEDSDLPNRICNSYYIKKTMQQYENANFIFVFDRNLCYNNEIQGDLTNSLQVFINLMDFVSLPLLQEHTWICVTKASNEDNCKTLQNMLGEFQKKLSSKAFQFFQQIVNQNNRVFFFRQPKFVQMSHSPKNIMQEVATSAMWKIQKQHIDYRSLVEGCLVQERFQIIKQYHEIYMIFMRLLMRNYAFGLEQILKKCSHLMKQYTFPTEWQKTVAKVQNIIKYTRIKQQNQKKMDEQYFCQYDLVQNYISKASELVKDLNSQKYLRGKNFFQIFDEMWRNARMTQSELTIYAQFSYIFYLMKSQGVFLRFLCKLSQKQGGIDYLQSMFINLNTKRFYMYCQQIKINETNKQPKYYKKALEIFDKIPDIDRNNFKLEQSKPILTSYEQCFRRLGDITQSYQDSIAYYLNGLVYERKITGLSEEQEKARVQKEAGISNKVAVKLFSLGMYSQAIQFFKINHFSLKVFECLKASPTYTSLYENSVYFAERLQFGLAEQTLQMAYEDETCIPECRDLAMKRLLEIQQKRSTYIQQAKQKLKQIGELSDPEQSLKNIKEKIKDLGKNQARDLMFKTIDKQFESLLSLRF